MKIMKLTEAQKNDYLKHLLELPEQDKKMRFNGAMNDASITSYVNGINWERDMILGKYDKDLNLVAAAHIGFYITKDQTTAEIGLSVDSNHRGNGTGYQIFSQAIMYARNHNANKIWVSCSRSNRKMINLAAKQGLELVSESTDMEGYLSVDKGNLVTWLLEIREDNLAFVDYLGKKQAKVFRDIFF
jgi:RimJ/RimL family protein N-acetyltransferase